MRRLVWMVSVGALVALAACNQPEEEPAGDAGQADTGGTFDAGDTAAPDTADDTGAADTGAADTTLSGPAEIVIEPASPTLQVSTTLQLTARFYTAGGDALEGYTANWASSAPDIVQMSPAGIAIGQAVGEATVTATFGELSATARVTVTPPAVASIDCVPANYTMDVGEEVRLDATLRGAGGAILEASQYDVSWMSDASAVVAVAPTSAPDSATATALGVGHAQVTAHSGGVTSSPCIIAVEASSVEVSRVTVTPASTAVRVGESRDLEATVYDLGDQPLAGEPVTWASDDDAIATVGATGVVTGRSAGTVTATATSVHDPTKAATATITVDGTRLFAVAGAGGATSCAVSYGTAWCWGANASGQVGDATTAASSPPSLVAGGHSFATVTVGADHSCGIDAAGDAWCWGADAAGQLGDDASLTARTAPASVASVGQDWAAIAAGDAFTCGATTAGAVYCWGKNDQRQLGASGADSPTPRAVSLPVSDAVAVTAGQSHACALGAGGDAFCWGVNVDGRLGNDATGATSTPVRVAGGYTYRAIAAGADHTCGVTTGGTVACWGANAAGQLGDGTTTRRASPVLVPTQTQFAQVAVGTRFSCAIAGGGDVMCWGAGSQGQLGDASGQDSVSPTTVAGGHYFTDLAAGLAHACATDDAGAVWCWGAGADAQLGAGSTGSNTPVEVSGF